MLKVHLFTIGTLPQGAFSEIHRDFAVRLKKFVDFEVRSFKSVENLLEALPKGDIVLLLDANGKQRTSEEFAKMIEKFLDEGQAITFVLGGPHGFTKEEKTRFSHSLSLSAMTTTHDLAHLFFLEQLYRAFTIIKGMTYHY